MSWAYGISDFNVEEIVSRFCEEELQKRNQVNQVPPQVHRVGNATKGKVGLIKEGYYYRKCVVFQNHIPAAKST